MNNNYYTLNYMPKLGSCKDIIDREAQLPLKIMYKVIH